MPPCCHTVKRRGCSNCFPPQTTCCKACHSCRLRAWSFGLSMARRVWPGVFGQGKRFRSALENLNRTVPTFSTKPLRNGADWSAFLSCLLDRQNSEATMSQLPQHPSAGHPTCPQLTCQKCRPPTAPSAVDRSCHCKKPARSVPFAQEPLVPQVCRRKCERHCHFGNSPTGRGKATRHKSFS